MSFVTVPQYQLLLKISESGIISVVWIHDSSKAPLTFPQIGAGQILNSLSTTGQNSASFRFWLIYARALYGKPFAGCCQGPLISQKQIHCYTNWCPPDDNSQDRPTIALHSIFRQRLHCGNYPVHTLQDGLRLSTMILVDKCLHIW